MNIYNNSMKKYLHSKLRVLELDPELNAGKRGSDQTNIFMGLKNEMQKKNYGHRFLIKMKRV